MKKTAIVCVLLMTVLMLFGSDSFRMTSAGAELSTEEYWQRNLMYERYQIDKLIFDAIDHAEPRTEKTVKVRSKPEQSYDNKGGSCCNVSALCDLFNGRLIADGFDNSCYFSVDQVFASMGHSSISKIYTNGGGKNTDHQSYQYYTLRATGRGSSWPESGYFTYSNGQKSYKLKKISKEEARKKSKGKMLKYFAGLLHDYPEGI